MSECEIAKCCLTVYRNLSFLSLAATKRGGEDVAYRGTKLK